MDLMSLSPFLAEDKERMPSECVDMCCYSCKCAFFCNAHFSEQRAKKQKA